jgi:ABC-type sugar transport system permease subunit
MQTISRPTRRLTLQQQDARIAFLLILPSLLIILGITLQPILATLYFSFFETSAGQAAPNIFRGVGNYVDLLKDPLFWLTIRRTLYFSLVSVGLELVLGLAIA